MRNPENRRIKLREWFVTNTIPAAEKSYISQLLGGTASFGEKAATRLEAALGMPDGYLDSAPGSSAIDENTIAVQLMMSSTDDEGRIRIKHAASDVLYEYNQKKNKRPKISESIEHAALLEQISKISDPSITSALQVVIDSFQNQGLTRKQG